VEATGEANRARVPALAARLANDALSADGGADAALALGHAQAALGRYADAERTFALLEGAPASQEAAVAYLYSRINVLVWVSAGAPTPRRWWSGPPAGGRIPPGGRRIDGMRLVVLRPTGRSQAAGELADRLGADPRLDPAAAPLVALGGTIGWLFAGQTAKALAIAERTAVPSPDDGPDGGLDDRALGGLVAWSLVRLETGRGWDELDEHVALIERASVARGDRVTAGPAAALRGSLALQRGKPVTAARRLREALAHLEIGDPRGLAVIAAAELAQAEALAGRHDVAARAEAAVADHLGSRPPAWHERSKLARAAGWVAVAAGDLSRGSTSAGRRRRRGGLAARPGRAAPRALSAGDRPPRSHRRWRLPRPGATRP
jgi:hypothetical protein